MTDTMLQRIAHLESEIAAMRQALGDETLPAGCATGPVDVHVSLSQALSKLSVLQPLLEDDTINDILINGPDTVFVERDGRLEKIDLRFNSDAEVFAMAQTIAAQAGRHVNTKRPLLDARLMDGSRVNIIAPPLAVDGTSISIRKFARNTVTLDRMAAQANMSPALAEFFKVLGRCRLNVVISGGTGSGKTTLLNAMAEFIDPRERVVTIEDAAELCLPQPNVVRLETRPMRLAHDEEEVSMRDLMKNALRMRPDRIIVGEVRGPEAFDMMQAMNTGHEGSLTTIHANHPRDALARLENMIMMANLNLPHQAIRSQIASAINLVVQISRMRDGHRRIAYVSEVVGMEGDIVTMQELFTFQSKGDGADGKLAGEFKWTGIMPRFLRRAAYYGESERLSTALGTRLPKL